MTERELRILGLYYYFLKHNVSMNKRIEKSAMEIKEKYGLSEGELIDTARRAYEKLIEW